jgi:hypothetical protein
MRIKRLGVKWPLGQNMKFITEAIIQTHLELMNSRVYRMPSSLQSMVVCERDSLELYICLGTNYIILKHSSYICTILRAKMNVAVGAKTQLNIDPETSSKICTSSNNYNTTTRHYFTIEL